MIGNDIVDFSIDEQNYLNLRFIQRILTALEQKYLSKSTDPNRFLWSLWAAKEAGFKAIQRENHTFTFSPVDFEVSPGTLNNLLMRPLATSLTGKVQFKQQQLALQYNWPTNTVVHCIVCLNTNLWTHIDNKISCVPNLLSYQHQSQAVRDLAQSILKKHHIKADIIRPIITMSGYHKPGPPILVKAGNRHPLPHTISLSHDHDYLAVALYYVPDGLK